MSYSSFLRRFGATATLIAIRAAVNEPPMPQYTHLPHDPWFGCDPNYSSAFAGVPAVVAW